MAGGALGSRASAGVTHGLLVDQRQHDRLINSIAAGVGVALLAEDILGVDRHALAVTLGVAIAVALIAAFVVYERWRFRVFNKEDRAE